jgi:Ca-activated chloride channel family protein
MSFLSPYSLLWAVPIIGAIVALYLLRMRRIEMKVPATFLWPQLTSDVRANAPFQKLRFSWLLVVQLLCAALIVFALAGPLHRTRGLAGAATVVILDDSASMQATDIAPTRFKDGLRRVNTLISSMEPFDRMALIVAGSKTKIIFPLANDKAQMIRSISSVAGTDAPSNMGEALRLATALVNGRPSARIVVFSDGNFPQVTDFSPGRAQLSYIAIGKSRKNVGITAFNSALLPSGKLTCFSAIHNFDSDPTNIKALFSVDDQLVDARRVTVPSGQSSYITFNAPPNGRKATLLIVAPGDMLPSDNSATIYLKGAGTIRTLLVTTGNLFLQNALSLDPQIRLETASDVPDYELASSRGPGRYDLVIFDNVSPRNVKAPAIWSLGVPAQQFGVKADGMTAHPSIVDWKRNDPVMRYADLTDVNISEAYRVSQIPGSATSTLVVGSAGPLVVSSHINGKRTLYTAWSVLDSDFPLHVSFPIFVANSVNWLTTGRGRASVEQGGVMATTGRTFSVGASDPNVTLTCPDGTQQSLTSTNGAVVIRSADHVGVYKLSGASGSTSIAVNLLNESASNIGPQTDLKLAGTPVKAIKSKYLVLAEIWRPVVCLVLLLLAGEWLLFVRRS